MSVQAISWAFRVSCEKPSDKLVLVSLANYSDAEGFCWPSVKKISLMTGLSVRSVRSCISRLDGVHLTIEKQRGSHGHQASNNYYLDLDGHLETTQSANIAPCESQSANNVIPGCKSRRSQGANLAPLYKEDPSLEPSVTTMSGKPDEAPPKSKKQEAIELLEFLNEKAGKGFEPVKSNITLIENRLKEYPLQKLKSMTMLKIREWKDDDKMKKFMRPATLYNATNCAQYTGELSDAQN